MLYITRGLVETLLRLASEKEPDATTIPLAVTAASELPSADLADDSHVFTHFYMPNKGDALNAVFGVDLTTPAGQTPGLFVSHPRGDKELSKRDDLREVVFVAIPPWDESSLSVYDRSGERMGYTVLDIEPPEESLNSQSASG